MCRCVCVCVRVSLCLWVTVMYGARWFACALVTPSRASLTLSWFGFRPCSFIAQPRERALFTDIPEAMSPVAPDHPVAPARVTSQSVAATTAAAAAAVAAAAVAVQAPSSARARVPDAPSAPSPATPTLTARPRQLDLKAIVSGSDMTHLAVAVKG